MSGAPGPQVLLLTVALALVSPGAGAGNDDGVPIAADKPVAASDPADPRDYLEFSNVLTSDCMLHRARLRRIANTHPDRAIRVVLWSYTGQTRSQGSSEKRLPPASSPRSLGCNGTSGLERRWVIESAEFVEAEAPNSKESHDTGDKIDD